jgi:hypothetical protein
MKTKYSKFENYLLRMFLIIIHFVNRVLTMLIEQDRKSIKILGLL